MIAEDIGWPKNGVFVFVFVFCLFVEGGGGAYSVLVSTRY